MCGTAALFGKHCIELGDVIGFVTCCRGQKADRWIRFASLRKCVQLQNRIIWSGREAASAHCDDLSFYFGHVVGSLIWSLLGSVDIFRICADYCSLPLQRRGFSESPALT